MVRQGQDLCVACSSLDPVSAAQSNGSSKLWGSGSRYVDGYEPESEYGSQRRSNKAMIDELSLRLSEPRDPQGALSSGDSIIADTVRKSRIRPHDRDRIDELAMPCKKGSSSASWRCPPPDPLAPPPGTGPDFTSTLSKNTPRFMKKIPEVTAKHMDNQRLDDLLSRLACPRERPPVGGNMATGEKIVMESQVAHKSKTEGNVCVRSLIARLSNPRVADPSVAPPSGEGVLLDTLARTPKRPPNHDHLSRLSRPNRRGGSALAWRCEQPEALKDKDDRTVTPLSMRTTSPPHLRGIEDDHERPTTSGSMSLKQGQTSPKGSRLSDKNTPRGQPGGAVPKIRVGDGS